MSDPLADRSAAALIALVPPYTTSPVAAPSRPYYPSGLQPPPQTTAIVRADDASAQSHKGLVDVLLEGLKNRLPEFGANAAATRANFSEAGLLFWKFMRAPLSFAVTLAAAAVSAITRGEGPIGTNATRIAVGAGHATVAEISRPKAAQTGSIPPGETASAAPAGEVLTSA